MFFHAGPQTSAGQASARKKCAGLCRSEENLPREELYTHIGNILLSFKLKNIVVLGNRCPPLVN